MTYARSAVTAASTAVRQCVLLVSELLMRYPLDECTATLTMLCSLSNTLRMLSDRLPPRQGVPIAGEQVDKMKGAYQKQRKKERQTEQLAGPVV